MHTFIGSNNGGSDLIDRKASQRGMSISPMYGQFAITFSPERIEQLRRQTGKLKPGVIALCGSLDEVNEFLDDAEQFA